MPDTGWVLPGTVVSDASFGSSRDWQNPSNATAIDDVRTDHFAFLSALFPDSNYLKSTNFGFAIPAGAIILGIETRAEGLFITGSSCTTTRVRLVDEAGVIGTTDKSDGATWSDGVDAIIGPWGGAADLWGDVWTPADINNSNFGFVLAPTHSVDTFGKPNVDYTQIRITYSLPPPPRGAPIFF